MQGDIAEQDKLKFHGKKESANIQATDKLPHRSSSRVKAKIGTSSDVFTDKRSVFHTANDHNTLRSSSSTNPRSDRKKISNDLIKNKAVSLRGQNSAEKQTKNVVSSSKAQVSSADRKYEDNSGPRVITTGKNHVGGNVYKPGKSHDRIISNHTREGINNLSISGGVVPKRATDKNDQNLKFKGGGRTNEGTNNLSDKTSHHTKESRKPSTPASYGQSKKTNTKDTKSKRDAVELSGVNPHKKKIKVVEKNCPEKIKSILSSNRAGLNFDECQVSVSDEKRKGIRLEYEKRSKMGHISPLKKEPSVRPSAVIDSSKKVVSRKREVTKIGRERTRTWTISSGSEDNYLDHPSRSTDSQVKVDANYENGMFSDGLEKNMFHKGDGDAHRKDDSYKKTFQTFNGLIRSKEEGIIQVRGDVQVVKENNVKSNEKEKQMHDKDMNAEENIGSLQGEYDYEDDFEDYESDFEECSDDDDGSSKNLTYEDDHSELQSGYLKGGEEESANTEEIVKEGEKKSAVEGGVGGKEEDEDGERKMDSGLYDSGRKRRREEEVVPVKLVRIDADEGFVEKEEGMKLAERSSDILSKNITGPPSHGCVSWKVYFCKRKSQRKEDIKKAYRRGTQLLQMITLDEISYSLFELPPIPYEAFMRSCGHLNTKQVSVQTNEDCRTESIQTDLIVMCDAWTQKPPVLGASATVGEDVLSHVLDSPSWNRLGRFMELAGEVMTILLEEQWTSFESVRQESTLPSTVFSKFSIKLGQDGSSTVSWESLLASRPVCSVRFCETQSNLLVCAHGPTIRIQGTEKKNSTKEDDEEPDLDYMSEASLLSVWSVSEPSCPHQLLSCQGNVSRTCFEGGLSKYGQFVFAGTEDGSICLWNLREKGVCHKKISLTSCHKEPVICPTFSTFGGETHLGRIVGLEPVVESDFCIGSSVNQISNKMETANQVCSLDEWGTVVVWSVVRRGSKSLGKVRLVASMQLCLGETDWKVPVKTHSISELVSAKQRLSLGPYDGIAMWNSLAVDHDWILAASDTGSIVCLPLNGDKRAVQVYPGSKDSFASAECIEVNPQGLPFFMVGNSVGQVRLYGHSTTRHFGSWEPPSSSLPSQIVSLAWSPQRPFVFFTVDVLSRMHIWDLASSDIFPLATVPPPKDGRIAVISLSFPKGKAPAYMAVGMDNGQVILHQLKEELSCRNQETSRKEVSQFLKYANLL